MEKKIYCWNCYKELKGLDHYESVYSQYCFCEECGDENLIETEYGFIDAEIDVNTILDDDLSDIDIFKKVKGERK